MGGPGSTTWLDFCLKEPGWKIASQTVIAYNRMQALFGGQPRVLAVGIQQLAGGIPFGGVNFRLHIDVW